MTQATDTVRAICGAFVNKDRAGAERLIAPDFRFTSPLDNGIDRETYFRLCWPNSEMIEAFQFIQLAEAGDRVFVTYEGRAGGKRFRNTEVHTLRGGQIAEVEVYFGWNVPHEVPLGEHRDPPARD
jgi:ketosteroid isomerase-like protein